MTIGFRKLAIHAALAIIISVGAIAPAHSKSHFDKGVDLQRQGKFADAIEEYKKAVRAVHASTATRKTGRVMGKVLGELTEIVSMGEYIHYSQPADYSDAKTNEATLYSNSGMCYYALRQYSEAEESFRKALKINSYVANAHYYLGLIRIEQKDYWNAIDEFGKDNSREADSAFQIGNCYAKLNLMDEARGSWQTAADKDIRYKSYPNVAKAIKYLAEDASRKEKYAKVQLENEKASEEEKFLQRMERRKQVTQNID